MPAAISCWIDPVEDLVVVAKTSTWVRLAPIHPALRLQHWHTVRFWIENALMEWREKQLDKCM